jgi:co-chaperonin GroES (HSP10)
MVMVRKLRTPEADHGDGVIIPDLAAKSFWFCEVVAVGPGVVDAGGGESPTHDLHSGQRVWIQAEQPSPQGPRPQYIRTTFDGETLYLVEQGNVLMILNRPGEWSPEDHREATAANLVITDTD